MGKTLKLFEYDIDELLRFTEACRTVRENQLLKSTQNAWKEIEKSEISQVKKCQET